MFNGILETRIVMVAAALALLCGCLESDLPVAGSYSEVVLVSEDGAQDVIARAFVPNLTRAIDYYIEEEQAFTVTNVRAADLLDAPTAKNIVICGVANPVTDVGRYIVSQLGDVSVERVRSGEANIFKREDLPGLGQLTLIVTALSTEDLVRFIELHGDEIVATLEASCRNRLRRHLLEYKDEVLTRRLRETYGFIIRVPTLYRVLSENAEPAGVELIREEPARVLGIFWLDWDHQPTLEDAESLYGVRARYAWERYDGDVMDSTRVEYATGRLGEYPAVTMSGYWSNTRAIAGGCYRTFFVYQEPAKLLWMIDLVVFAPGLPKHPHFRELWALAETFRYE